MVESFSSTINKYIEEVYEQSDDPEQDIEKYNDVFSSND